MGEGRENRDWLDELGGGGRERDAALSDLRQMIERRLPFALSRWISPTDPHFEGLIQESTQEALLKVLDSLPSFEGRSKFSTWVLKIAVRVALTELRRARWKDVSLDELVDPDRAGGTFQPEAGREMEPSRVVERRDIMERIGRVINEELTENQRLALLAVHVHAMPTEEVARRLGTNRNALYKMMHDARLKLKRRLALEGIPVETILESLD